ncbi:hypothetical protein D3C87_1572530 [compost metagenome]
MPATSLRTPAVPRWALAEDASEAATWSPLTLTSEVGLPAQPVAPKVISGIRWAPLAVRSRGTARPLMIAAWICSALAATSHGFMKSMSA